MQARSQVRAGPSRYGSPSASPPSPPAAAPAEAEEGQPNASETLPEIYTARYLATDVLASGAVVPVRISMYPPEPLLGPALPYRIEHAVRELAPLPRQRSEWRRFSPTFWRHLDETGPERIASCLARVAEGPAGSPSLSPRTPAGARYR